jgi:D-hexose-6-phosphate mutarotase
MQHKTGNNGFTHSNHRSCQRNPLLRTMKRQKKALIHGKRLVSHFLNVEAETLYLSVNSPYKNSPEKAHKISSLKTEDAERFV